MNNEEELASRKAAFLSALANSKRLLILHLLTDRELPVGVLADRLGLSQSATSQHLGHLREKKMVTARREAQTIYYTGCSEAVRTMLNVLADIYSTPLLDQRKSVLAD